MTSLDTMFASRGLGRRQLRLAGKAPPFQLNALQERFLTRIEALLDSVPVAASLALVQLIDTTTASFN